MEKVLDTYQKNLVISPSAADMAGKMSYHAAFELFMDLAAEHAEHIGLGFAAMAEKNRFWLTVKTKILFYRRPAIEEAVTACTWLEPPEKIRCKRNYAIQSKDEILAAGKTEWAVMDTALHTLVPIALVYPNTLKYDKPPAFTDRFARIQDTFASAEVVEDYRVRSTDIDIGGHMNNAAYLRALFGSFSCDELQTADIRCVDADFRKPAFEGDVLTLQRVKTDNVLLFRYAKGEENVFLARIETAP